MITTLAELAESLIELKSLNPMSTQSTPGAAIGWKIRRVTLTLRCVEYA
jgi:hypothetical protein